MAYFSNSETAFQFQDKNCQHCYHWLRDAIGDHCPIMDVHFGYQGGHKEAQAVLDMLINPTTKKCTMKRQIAGSSPEQPRLIEESQ